MQRTLIFPDVDQFPDSFRPLLQGCPVYDSSCSPDARVYFIDQGLYLKSAPAGTLAQEAAMTAYFHNKGLSAEVLQYLSTDQDWLLTRAVPGEDCTNSPYLEDPKRLSETLGTFLRQLHSIDPSDCPTDRIKTYVATAEQNFHAGIFAADFAATHLGYHNAEDAWRVIENGKHLLKQDVLLHGDYCLPNILLNNWNFSGFIDVGNGGIGDRHIDLFWGIWSLGFNTKSDAYRDRFLDAYGREDVEEEMFPIIRAFECFG